MTEATVRRVDRTAARFDGLHYDHAIQEPATDESGLCRQSGLADEKTSPAVGSGNAQSQILARPSPEEEATPEEEMTGRLARQASRTDVLVKLRRERERGPSHLREGGVAWIHQSKRLASDPTHLLLRHGMPAPKAPRTGIAQPPSII